jgi:uncharacterized membrane protein YfcA
VGLCPNRRSRSKDSKHAIGRFSKLVEFPLIIVSAFVLFAAGLLASVTGFGFFLVAVPILTVYLEPILVVPTLVLLGFGLSIVLMLSSYRSLNVRRVWILALAGAITTPVGAALLVILDPFIIKIVAGTVVGVASIGMLTGFRRAAEQESATSIAVGAASGLLSGSTALAGPPIVLFFSNQGVPPREFRANLIFYFAALDLVGLPSYAAAGILTRDSLMLAGQLAPGAAVGVLLGLWLAPRVPVVVFRRVALVIVLVSGLATIASGVAAAL